METILVLIAIIGMLTIVVGAALGLTEFFSLHGLKTHLHGVGINVYSAEKNIRNNLDEDSIGKRTQLTDAQVIFSSKNQCRFTSRFTFNSIFSPIHQMQVKGEIIWAGEHVKINARMPLGYIIILIGVVVLLGTIPLGFLFEPSNKSISTIEMFIPFIIIFGLSFMYYVMSKKNALRIINCIMELVQPKNI